MWLVWRATSQSLAYRSIAGASASDSGRRISRAVSSRIVLSGASAPVVGIDVDIAVRQIARPDPRRAAADADIDRDVDLGALHVGRHGGLVILVAPPPGLGDQRAADGDAEAVAIGPLAGL